MTETSHPAGKDLPARALPALALVTAAGSSTRMGSGTKKEYIRIDRSVAAGCAGEAVAGGDGPAEGGETVISLALRAFLSRSDIAFVCVTHREGERETLVAALAPDLLPELGSGRLIPCAGGATRRESVLSGLRELARLAPAPGTLVLVHDGARPFAGKRLIDRVVAAARECGAAIPVVATTDTCKEIDQNGFVSRHLDRRSVMAAQTPQAFGFAPLLAAHEEAERLMRSLSSLSSASGSARPREFTDDAEIWERFVARSEEAGREGTRAGRGEHAIRAVEGDIANRKITRPGDIP